MFIITVVILCVFVLKTCVQESCRIIPINSDIMEGECCIFTTHEDSRHKTREILEEIIKESLPKTNHLKRTQSLLEPCPEDTTRRRRHPKTRPSNISPMPTADQIKPEIQNTFVLPPDENIIIPIRGDKIHGECNILLKDKCYRRENDKIIPTVVGGEFLPKRGVPSKEKVQGMQPSGVVPPNISPINILKPPQKRLADQNEPRPYVGLELSDFVDQTPVSSDDDDYFEDQSTLVSSEKPEVSQNHKIKNQTHLEVGNNNATASGKIIIDLNNRNAVDVPPIKCPNGQARDPSGNCVSPF